MQKLFFILIFLTSQAIAQDTLLLISGRTIIVSSVDLQNNTVAYRKIKPGSPVKTISPERVFSVLHRDGTESIVYVRDTLDPIDFKVEEMRNFIKGERDARELYRNTFVKVLGLGVGVGSATFLGFYGLVGPPIYSTIVQQIPANVDHILSFKIDGSAAGDLGLSPGKYVNEITGSKVSPGVKKDQQLKIANRSLKFNSDMNLDQTVALINANKKCSGIKAANLDGKIKLYKTNSAAILNDDSYLEGFEKRVREYKVRSAWVSGIIGFVAGSVAYSVFRN